MFLPGHRIEAAVVEKDPSSLPVDVDLDVYGLWPKMPKISEFELVEPAAKALMPHILRVPT
jgi:hypothetical protein